MRLYALKGQSAVHHEDDVHEVDPETNAIEVPHELGEYLHRTHVGGEKQWEDDAERSARLVSEHEARRKDPATLLGAVETLTEKVENAALLAKVAELEAQLAEASKPKRAPAKPKPAPAEDAAE